MTKDDVNVAMAVLKSEATAQTLGMASEDIPVAALRRVVAFLEAWEPAKVQLARDAFVRLLNDMIGEADDAEAAAEHIFERFNVTLKEQP